MSQTGAAATMSVGKHGKDTNRKFSTPSTAPSYRSNDFTCQLCNKEFVDPRVLPCLHTFCIECLEKLELEQNPRPVPAVKRSQHGRFQDFLAGYYSKSGTRQHEYVRLKPISDHGHEVTDHRDESPWTRASRTDAKTCRPRLICPICGFDNAVPARGVQDLPPHYILQHRMLIDSLNRGEIQLLCDLCSSEISASFRCTRCLLNLCTNCSKSHKREKLFPDHELKRLKSGHQEGMGITRVRRQVMCPAHSEKELKFYCTTCNMVACTECFVEFHRGHNCESFSRAAQTFTSRIRDELERTKLINKDAAAALARLNALSQQIESKYSQVQKEINNYIDGYVTAFEDHRTSLLTKATQIRNGQMQTVKTRQKEVEKKAQDIGHTLKFGEDLIREGSEFEVLSFAYYLLRRLEWCVRTGGSALSSAFSSCVGSMEFLPEERAGNVKNRSLYGVVTTQVVSPSNCYITPEGVDLLKNCRERQRCDLTLVTKDSYDQRLTHGAEGIEVDLRCKNGPHRQVPIYIVDQQNGLYIISFTPDVSGKMTLSVSIRGVPIKGSPFSVHVRPRQGHRGTFHCCTFCSSGGNKNAVCGCGGRMPGGYQGCGHGYVGHPGGHHWSCCGNTLQKSECLGSLRTEGFYQLRL